MLSPSSNPKWLAHAHQDKLFALTELRKDAAHSQMLYAAQPLVSAAQKTPPALQMTSVQQTPPLDKSQLSWSNEQRENNEY